jgi:hypothetical protein
MCRHLVEVSLAPPTVDLMDEINSYIISDNFAWDKSFF